MIVASSSSNEPGRRIRRERQLQQRASRRFPWHWQGAQIAGQTIHLAVPTDPLQGLSDFSHHRTSDCSLVHDPFWAQVWKSTQGIDHYLGQRNLAGARVLELGCGTGAAGMSALLRGGNVTFTDGVSTPLLLVRISLAAWKLQQHSADSDNANRSPSLLRSQIRHTNRWRVRRLRFGHDILPAQRFSLIIGSDISYLKEVWPELLRTLDVHLEPGGEVLLSDPYRSISTEFSAWVRCRRHWLVEEHHQSLCDGAIRVLRLTRC